MKKSGSALGLLWVCKWAALNFAQFMLDDWAPHMRCRTVILKCVPGLQLEHLFLRADLSARNAEPTTLLFV